MKRILIVVAALLFVSCTEKPKLTREDMQAYEKEFKEKIKVAKVEIVQMKLDLQKAGDSLANAYSGKLDDFEDRLNAAEDEYSTFKNITEKDVWIDSKAKLDSVIGYLELQIDSTKTNIDQMVE